MTRSEELRKKIQKSGYKYKFLASALGLSYYALKLKIDNKNDFTASEICTLCDILKITSLKEKEYIFFASNV